MNDLDRPPSSVATRRSRQLPTPVKEDDDSDFDEFGFEHDSPEKDTEVSIRDGSTKPNKTRLGKLMSKAATTFGSLKVLSPKKPSSTTDRHSLSSTSSSAKFTAPSTSRNTISAAKPPSLSRTRPESLPVSRHSEVLPVRRPSSSRVPARPLPAFPTATAGATRAPSEDDVGDTWREVEQARLSAAHMSDGSGSERDAVNSAPPVVQAQSLHTPVPTSYASPDSVVPVMEVHSSTQPGKVTGTLTITLEEDEETPTGPRAQTLPAVTTNAFVQRPFIYGNTPAATPKPDAPAATQGTDCPAGEAARSLSPARSTPSRPLSTAHSTPSCSLSTTHRTPSRPLSTTHSTPSRPSSTLSVRSPEDCTSPEPVRAPANEEVLSFGIPSAPLQEVSTAAPVTALPVKVDAKPLAIVRYLRLLVRFSPQPLSSFFARLEPIVTSWAHTLHFVLLTLYIFLEIILELAIELWVVLKPYKPELLLPSFAGLVMCFFGGSFVTTIAAAEAYRLVGYESTRECLNTLMEEFQQVVQAAERDAAIGVDDVEPTESSGKAEIANAAMDDPWGDWRQETETPRTRPVSGAFTPPPKLLFYSDGTELLSEKHHHANISAQTYHLEDVLPTPKSRGAAPSFSTATTTATPTPPVTRRSMRLSGKNATTPAGAFTPSAPPLSSSKKSVRKRRSMFDAHPEALEAFKHSVLEHQQQHTPAKSRSFFGRLTSSASTTPSSASKVSAKKTDATQRLSAGIASEIPTTAAEDSVGSETEQTQRAMDSTPVPVPMSIPVPALPTPASASRRASAVPQSLQEYQREQEVFGADTTASRALFFLQNVDPQRFTTAIVGLNAGVVAVVATLKVQFAKTITLGAALGKAIDGPAKVLLLPLVEMALPKPYKKWADILVTYSVKSFAISIAWTLRRVMSSFHSAIRGGLMFSTNLLSYLTDMGYLSKAHSESFMVKYLDKILGYSFALLGLWFQLTYGFALPFPLNVILFPFTILEYMLVWLVNNSHYVLGHYT